MTDQELERAADKTQNKEFRWVHINNRDELERFYLSIIGKIRAVAKECGYAIGIHGSLRRDMDLIAVPWKEECANKDELASSIHRAACGLESSSYQWEQKPRGRVATSFPVCWTEWNEPNLGHIDLSVADLAHHESHSEAEIAKLKEELVELRKHLCVEDACLQYKLKEQNVALMAAAASILSHFLRQ